MPIGMMMVTIGEMVTNTITMTIMSVSAINTTKGIDKVVGFKAGMIVMATTTSGGFAPNRPRSYQSHCLYLPASRYRQAYGSAESL